MIIGQHGGMLGHDHFFVLGDSAEEAGDFAAARDAFEQGIASGEDVCLGRLGMMYDVGRGVAIDKRRALKLYLLEWRASHGSVPATNIAILYREAGNHRAMFQWFSRAVEAGCDDSYLDLAKCYHQGLGVPQSDELAVRCLAAVLRAPFVFDETRDQAQDMMRAFGPRAV